VANQNSQPRRIPVSARILPIRKHRNDSLSSGTAKSRSVYRTHEVPRDKSSRKGANSVPLPQRDRIKQKFISGKNITQIAREEGRHWVTVSRIVKEADVQEYVKDLRARFYGGLHEMLFAAIEYAKSAKDGGWLAYQMLRDAGVIPDLSKKADVNVAELRPPATEEQEAVRRIAMIMVEGAIERHKYFGMELPETDGVGEKLLAKAKMDRKSLAS
jgi:hypothetical protein